MPERPCLLCRRPGAWPAVHGPRANDAVDLCPGCLAAELSALILSLAPWARADWVEGLAGRAERAERRIVSELESAERELQ
jgi:hypothetical protein